MHSLRGITLVIAGGCLVVVCVLVVLLSRRAILPYLKNMEAQKQFITNASHELKTPLAVIQNYGTMLQQPGLTEEKRLEYARSVTDSARRLASLVTNILKLNKLENQQIFPAVSEYN